MSQPPKPQQSPPPSPPENDEDTDIFSSVLAALNAKHIPCLAKGVLEAQGAGDDPEPTVGGRIFGSYHVIYPISFANGTRWALKIPVNGVKGKWDESSSAALTSEAETMRLLRRETTMPIPDVFDYSSTTENPLHCPYILMSFVTGVSLYDVWFGNRLGGTTPEDNHSHRVRALRDIASAMTQLAKFSCRTGGRPLFSETGGGISGIGKSRRVDQRAMLDRWFVHRDPADDPIYVEFEPSGDQKRYYTAMLDIRPPEDKPYPRGLDLILRQFIEWIPESTDAEPFVLSHPDFDIQNFLVSETGELVGIIDWDGVDAVPRSIGNERYPGWLTRDWDPATYGYKPSMEDGVEPRGVWEDSTATLAEYRGIYDGLVAGSRGDGAPNFCRMSLVTDNLAIAAQDPVCRTSILRKILQEIWAGAGEDGPCIMELADLFVEGNVDDDLRGKLKTGFEVLLTKEGL